LKNKKKLSEMKRNVGLSWMLILGLFVMVSCDGTGSKKSDEDKSDNETKKIEIKYLEDFMQFENHEQMVEYFGDENVEETVLWKAEGTVQYNVSILNPQFTFRVVVYWGVDDEKEGADFIETTYSVYTYGGEELVEGGAIYPTKTEVEIGTSLPELQEINGAAFTFLGMAWDFGGAAIDLDSRFDDYDIYLGCPEVEKLNDWPEEYTNIVGDTEFSSENEYALALDLEIVSITYLGE
jgi:hypothetical protein